MPSSPNYNDYGAEPLDSTASQFTAPSPQQGGQAIKTSYSSSSLWLRKSIWNLASYIQRLGSDPGVYAASASTINSFASGYRSRLVHELRDLKETQTCCVQSDAGSSTQKESTRNHSRSTTSRQPGPNGDGKRQKNTHSTNPGGWGPDRRGLDGDDEPNDGNSPKDGSGPSSPLSSETPRRLFACPFQKKDPATYSECNYYVLDNTSRVKDHIKRIHYIQFYCPTCKEIFADENGRDQHLQASNCIAQDVQFDQVTAQQLEQIKKRSRSNLDPEEWFKVFRIIYPKAELPISPYVDLSEELQTVRTHFLAQGPRICAELMRDHLPSHLQPYINDIQRSYQAIHPRFVATIFYFRMPSASRRARRRIRPVSHRSSSRDTEPAFQNTRPTDSQVTKQSHSIPFGTIQHFSDQSHSLGGFQSPPIYSNAGNSQWMLPAQLLGAPGSSAPFSFVEHPSHTFLHRTNPVYQFGPQLHSGIMNSTGSAQGSTFAAITSMHSQQITSADDVNSLLRPYPEYEQDATNQSLGYE